ncbi:MAG: hydrogen gas-evolving membrane-bound hydrogenase subunit E [Candidatus Margulisiibacteriota bacterium]
MTLAGIFLLTALVTPLVWAGVVTPLSHRIRRPVWLCALAGPAISALFLAGAMITAYQPFLVSVHWVPALDIPLGFIADPLSLFFTWVAVLMGGLVMAYAGAYFAPNDMHSARFYVYTLLFMTAMMATVLSENLIGLVIFWELTGLLSFLLIGYDRDSDAARRSASVALITTAGTGLVMLAGVVLLGFANHTFSIATLLAHPLGSDKIMTIALVMTAIGAFGKSAQFPFQFWLPRAMVAPVPVSAYLHSAAMVNLGIFLLARLSPVLSGLSLWSPLLITIGGISMLLGATMALTQPRMKGILAYATVSYLGYLVLYLGTAPRLMIPDFAIQLGCHILYKAALFMIVGYVMSVAGTDDISKLRGLYRQMPWMGGAAILATLTMAAFPGTWGFWAKESMATQLIAFGAVRPLWAAIAYGMVIASAALMVAVSLRLVYPLLLPTTTLPPIPKPALTRLFQGIPIALVGLLWLLTPVLGWYERSLLTHGWLPFLFVSVMPLLFGVGLYVVRPWQWFKWEFGTTTRHRVYPIWSMLDVDRWIGFLRPSQYLRYIVGFMTVVIALATMPAWRYAGWHLGQVPAVMWIATAVILAAVGSVIKKGAWVRRVVGLSAVGIGVVFYFMIYSAPDLAITQLLIEAVTLILILALLARFPKVPARSSGPTTAAIGLAVLGGLTAMALTLIGTSRTIPNLGSYYLENTLTLAHGANAVNTVVVDFRGFDTLGEVTVLAIALLGAMALLGTLTPNQNTSTTPMRSFVLTYVSRIAILLINVLAIYMLLRGHDAPGGGFSAGVLSALSLLLAYLTSGKSGTVLQLLRISPFKLVLIGLTLVYGTALLPVFLGRTFGDQMALWGMGTTLVFDIGIYCVVVGSTVKLLMLANDVFFSKNGTPA